METLMQILLGAIGAMAGLILLHKLFPKVLPGMAEAPPPFPRLLGYWSLTAAITLLIWEGIEYASALAFPATEQLIFIPMESAAYFLPSFLLGLLAAGYVQMAWFKWRHGHQPEYLPILATTTSAAWVAPLAGSLSVIQLLLITQTRIEVHPDVALSITPFGGSKVVYQPQFIEQGLEPPLLVGTQDTLSLAGYRWEILRDYRRPSSP
jgi:hypothetical protein